MKGVPMTIEQKRLELIKSFKEGNQNAFNELSEGLISVRNIMTKRYLTDDRSYMDEDDITQIFYEAVLTLLLKEDIESICYRFNQLINTRMTRKIESMIESHNIDKDLCELYACIRYEKYDHKSIEDIVMEDRFHDDMIKAIKRNRSIDERDKEIIIKFFGLNDDNEKSIQSLSKEYKISRNRICQIIEKGIRRLRHSRVPVMLIDYLH